MIHTILLIIIILFTCLCWLVNVPDISIGGANCGNGGAKIQSTEIYRIKLPMRDIINVLELRPKDLYHCVFCWIMTLHSLVSEH